MEPFYSETGRWWGGAESPITERDHARVDTVRRLTGRRHGRLLDLGSSYGNTAAAFALAGYDVTGVEISDRIQFADQHLDTDQLSGSGGTLKFIRGDFSQVDLDQRFELVTYWNGFGIGSDRDQRTLLNRIARKWLQPDGWLVIDVFNPVVWTLWAGHQTHRDADPAAGYPYSVDERTDYDPVRARFIDRWSRDAGCATITQTQRCYSPADFVLLLEPTDLEIEIIELDGEPLGLDKPADGAHPLSTAYEYQVLLRRRNTGRD
jgi:SAM-dependent methyltransferase